MKRTIYVSIFSALILVITPACIFGKTQDTTNQVTKKVTAKPAGFSFTQSFKDVCAYITPKKPEKEIIQKKYPIAKGGTFSLHNCKGKIEIEPVWNTNIISVTAIKQGTTKENLDKIKIVEKVSKDRVLLTVNDTNVGDKKARIDFKVIVPGNTVLDVVNKQGNIIARQIDKHFSATTARGNIEVNGAIGPVVASTTIKGNISISNARGPINAMTRIGAINIKESFHSILASTHRGRIDVHSVNVPSTSKIHLTSNDGNITLRLPKEVNADIQARTSRGEFTCMYPVTLKSHTTPLNKDAWQRFRKEATGSIGSGEAQILLTSNRSNISVVENQAIVKTR